MENLKEAHCLLCGSKSYTALEKIDSSELSRLYQTEFTTVPSQVTESKQVFELQNCLFCDLQFFLPIFVGNEEFYNWISAQNLYAPNRWEFDFVLSLLDTKQRILDVGAGSGTFALKALAQGHEVIAMDYSENARNYLTKLGIKVVADFAELKRLDFEPSLVTSFQVFEHLVNPTESLEQIHLNFPKARVAVSVPNRDRTRFRKEVFDFPPHHLTRWNEKALRECFRIANYRDCSVYFEKWNKIDSSYVLAFYLSQRFYRQLGLIFRLFRFSHLGLKILALKVADKSKLYGHSMMIISDKRI
ncbi:unannotated protein [freshwater metagenome]|uniref:Unannotated protein n=1 Tax=freshwater metagenome TaxID=449393 RepID=A0A6J6TW70_9ZZZZ|nr:methyltransferase domain-containing protein [Actinomycetota bacterium]